MPRVRVRTRVRNTNKNTNEQVLLFIAFWVAVIIECVSLYEKSYFIYAISRMFVAPVLLIRTFWSPSFRKISLYFYLFLVFSILADLFTTFGNYTFAYIGQSIYTTGFLCLGCYFRQLKSNHNISHLVLIVGAVLFAVINLLWLRSPELHNTIYYIQIAAHTSVLIYLAYETFEVTLNTSKKISASFVLGVVIILLTNMIYGLDILCFLRRYSIVDALVGLGNGAYLFIITRNVLLDIKKNS
jgi:uncharacterized membrane protein YhhN